MTPAEIIEAVARAISRPEIQALGPQAKAAILATLDAIREPPESVLEHGYISVDRITNLLIWRRQIDALKREVRNSVAY